MKIGDTITFTLTPDTTEDNASVAGSYNSQALSWSTADNGVTYTAVYTVTDGESDQGTAIQISGVILTDSASNASGAVGGSGIT